MPRGRERKKGKSGVVAHLMDRDRALGKLQLSLKDFRKLCILKGIYPRVPPAAIKKKNKTYYHTKDIMFLYHDPIIAQIRKYKTYRKRIRKYQGRREIDHVKALKAVKPRYNFDHMVKERYPSFVEALRDLDDALTMVFLFASLPQTNYVKAHVTTMCQRLSFEWMNYVMRARCLRKAFLSIKGIYFQARIMGEAMTWIMPYPFTPNVPKDVDYRIMLSFLEFHAKHLSFVLYRLYADLGLAYPPAEDEHSVWQGATLTGLAFSPLSAEERDAKEQHKREEQAMEDAEVERLRAANKAEVAEMEQEVARVEDELKRMGVDASAFDDADVDDDEAGEDARATLELRDAGNEFKQLAVQTGDVEAANAMDELQDPLPVLFRGLVVFVQRENLRDPLHFALEACGALVGWDGETSPFGIDDEAITHVICDRPAVANPRADREYVQPQWVFDSINFEYLLAPHEYAPGKELPPHLSPFVNDDQEGYVPERKKEILAFIEEAKGTRAARAEQAAEEPEEDHHDLRDAEDIYQEGLALELGAADQEGAAAARAKSRRREREAAEEKQIREEKALAAGTLTRKKRKLYEKIQFGQKKKAERVDKLKAKASKPAQ